MCSASATVYLVSDSVGEGHFSLSNLLMPVGIPQRYTIPATSVKSVVKCLAPVPPPKSHQSQWYTQPAPGKPLECLGMVVRGGAFLGPKSMKQSETVCSRLPPQRYWIDSIKHTPVFLWKRPLYLFFSFFWEAGLRFTIHLESLREVLSGNRGQGTPSLHFLLDSL